LNCLKCEQNISVYIDNELKPRERERLEAHLKGCSACRMKLESTRELSNRLKALTRLEGGLTERNRLLASLHEKISREPSPKSVYQRIPYKRFAFAGATVLAVLIVMGIYLTSGLRETTPPFEFEYISQPKNAVASGTFDEAIFDRMIELIKYERLEASSHEVFSEQIRGVFIYEPAPPKEGKFEDVGSKNNTTG